MTMCMVYCLPFFLFGMGYLQLTSPALGGADERIRLIMLLPLSEWLHWLRKIVTWKKFVYSFYNFGTDRSCYEVCVEHWRVTLRQKLSSSNKYTKYVTDWFYDSALSAFCLLLFHERSLRSFYFQIKFLLARICS